MKILVTGAGGFLGTALVERLLAYGHDDIRCNLRRRAGMSKLDLLRLRYPKARLSYCVGNLKYREDAARVTDGVDLIFHLAAGLRGAAADLFLDSVVASKNLLEAVADRKPMRIVLVSSLGVYGVAGLGRGARVNEQTSLEPHPEWRDDYSHTKLRQEELFWEYQRRNGFELVVVRPGVIYGPGGAHFSDRVGLTIAQRQIHVGHNNLLPLTFVDNCAEAIVVVGTHQGSAGEAYNVVDDNPPTCREYLRAYKAHVQNVRSIPVPYIAMRLSSWLLARYHKYSKGQLPAVLTPYKVASLWGGHRFENAKLHSIGWRQPVPSAEGLRRTFAAFRDGLKASDTQRAPAAIVPALKAMTSSVQNNPLESRQTRV